MLLGAFERFIVNNVMQIRDLCPGCLENLVAINYISNGRRYYRSRCASCIRKQQKIKSPPPLWVKSGYSKKERCEMCNFKAKSFRQLFVWHVDGNLKNVAWTNLKTVCANCQIELASLRVPWKPAPILPDF